MIHSPLLLTSFTAAVLLVSCVLIPLWFTREPRP